MMIASARARLLVAIIALILVLPIAGIRLQDDQTLTLFHRRSLNAWPASSGFMSNPVQYFVHARAWLADRVYPIRQTSAFASRFLFFVLGTAPQRNISLADDDFYFLNSGDEASANAILESVCVQAHTAATASELQGAIDGLANYVRGSGMPVDVLVIPTSATIYGDRVPASVPPRIRSACQERARGGSPLRGIRPPQGVDYLFPFEEMKAARDDEAFFPKGNFHAKGLSLKVVRDAYLASLHAQAAVDDTLRLGSEPAEVLKIGGVIKNQPVYVLRNEHVSADANGSARVARAVADLFPHPAVQSHFYRNTRPAIAQSVLILSDSYGNLTSEAFAGAFQNVIQITCNFLAADHVAQVIERVSRLEHVDRVILLNEEGQVGMIITWSRALGAVNLQDLHENADRIFQWRQKAP